MGERPDLTPREAIPIFSNFSSVSFNSLLPLISLVLNAAACFLNSGPSDSIHEATAASSQSFTEEKKEKKRKKKRKVKSYYQSQGSQCTSLCACACACACGGRGGGRWAARVETKTHKLNTVGEFFLPLDIRLAQSGLVFFRLEGGLSTNSGGSCRTMTS